MKTKCFRLSSVLIAVLLAATLLNGCQGKNVVITVSEDTDEEIFYNENSDGLNNNEDVTGSTKSTANSKNSGAQSAVMSGTIASDVGEKELVIPPSVFEDKYKEKLPGTVVNLVLTGQPDAYYRAMVKAFEARYKCTVKLSIYAWTEWEKQFANLVAKGEAPDAAIIFDAQFIGFVTQKLLQPVDEFVDKNAELWDKNYMKMFNWQGKQYAVSGSKYNDLVIYYNKDMVNTRGLEDPYTVYKAGNWTFNKFLEYASALKQERNGQVSVYGFNTWVTDSFALASGATGVILGANNSIINDLTNPKYINGIDMFRKMIANKSFSTGETKLTEDFRAGRVAMIAERPFNAMGAVDMYKKANFEIGLVPYPKPDKNSPHISPAIIEGCGIPRGAKNPWGGMAWTYYHEVFNKANEKTKTVIDIRKKSMSDEHMSILDEMRQKNASCNSFINGVGNWGTKKWEALFKPVFDGKSADTVIAAAKDILEAEIKSLQ